MYTLDEMNMVKFLANVVKILLFDFSCSNSFKVNDNVYILILLRAVPLVKWLARWAFNPTVQVPVLDGLRV